MAVIMVMYWLSFIFTRKIALKFDEVRVNNGAAEEFYYRAPQTYFTRHYYEFLIIGLIIPIIMVVAPIIIYKRKIKMHESDSYLGVGFVSLFIVACTISILAIIFMLPSSIY